MSLTRLVLLLTMRNKNRVWSIHWSVLTMVVTVMSFPSASFSEEAHRPVFNPGQQLLFQEELEQLRESLARSVFRAEARHVPPEPYQQTPLVYDGAVVAIDHEGLAFLTSATWLTQVDSVALIDDERVVPLAIERIDLRYDLALLRLAPSEQLEVRPLAVAEETPSESFSLLSPQTKYEQLASVRVVQESAERGLTWTTTLAATNGYPLISSSLGVVAVHCRRSPSEPARRGLAVGWPVIREFLHPPEDRAPALIPSRVLGTRDTAEQKTAWWATSNN